MDWESDMRVSMAFLAACAAMTAAGVANAATVEVRDAVARVTVVPEDRSDVKVEFLRTHDKLPITVRTEGDRTIIDGDLGKRVFRCNNIGKSPKIGVRGVGDIRTDDMPHIVIRAPRQVEIEADSAIIGEIGRSTGLRLKVSGCDNWTIADVAGHAELRNSGAGVVRMGAADRLKVRLSGAASIHATHIRKGVDADLSGAGSLKIDRADGQIEANVSGVGKVEVEGGRATSLNAHVSGVGGVEYGGVADSLDASISGIGSVRVSRVTGSVHKSVSGIGRVTISED
jgi:hypothetical protein